MLCEREKQYWHSGRVVHHSEIVLIYKFLVSPMWEQHRERERDVNPFIHIHMIRWTNNCKACIKQLMPNINTLLELTLCFMTICFLQRMKLPSVPHVANSKNTKMFQGLHTEEKTVKISYKTSYIYPLSKLNKEVSQHVILGSSV